jgi:hypothetical protein
LIYELDLFCVQHGCVISEDDAAAQTKNPEVFLCESDHKTQQFKQNFNNSSKVDPTIPTTVTASEHTEHTGNNGCGQQEQLSRDRSSTITASEHILRHNNGHGFGTY